MNTIECLVLISSFLIIGAGAGFAIGVHLISRRWRRMYDQLVNEYCHYIRTGEIIDHKKQPTP